MTLYSFSTVLMAILASNLLLALVVLCFFNTKIMENAGCKLLMLFVLFTAMRFLFPFEMPNAIRIPIPKILSETLGPFQNHGISVLGLKISFWNICELIWLLGAIIGIARYIALCIHTRNYIILNQKMITNQVPCVSIINQICENQHKPNRFQLIELPGIDTPMLYGIFSPRILIPESFQVTEDELYCYLSHEATHHFHHDLLLKTLVKLITIVYWWNPFCLILNEQTDMVLEMRVDSSLTKSDSHDTAIYAHCLLDMAERVIDHTNVPKILSMSFLTKSRHQKGENLTKRIQMLLANQNKKNLPLNILLLAAMAIIFLLSYLFIFETHYIPPTVDNQIHYVIPAKVNNYAIQNSDGTYDIYCYDLYFETVDSLVSFPNTPVYTEDHRPTAPNAPNASNTN